MCFCSLPIFQRKEWRQINVEKWGMKKPNWEEILVKRRYVATSPIENNLSGHRPKRGSGQSMTVFPVTRKIE
jgi:hypothetical protein